MRQTYKTVLEHSVGPLEKNNPTFELKKKDNAEHTGELIKQRV